MLKVGDENVSSAEVEGFLVNHPTVQIVETEGSPTNATNQIDGPRLASSRLD